MIFSFGLFYLRSIKYHSAVFHCKLVFVFLQICRYVHEQQCVQNILFLLHRKYKMLECLGDGGDGTGPSGAKSGDGQHDATDELLHLSASVRAVDLTAK